MFTSANECVILIFHLITGARGTNLMKNIAFTYFTEKISRESKNRSKKLLLNHVYLPVLLLNQNAPFQVCASSFSCQLLLEEKYSAQFCGMLIMRVGRPLIRVVIFNLLTSLFA